MPGDKSVGVFSHDRKELALPASNAPVKLDVLTGVSKGAAVSPL
jgi:hypothetical protein